MGHIVNSDRLYNRLQGHLDQSVTGAPNSPTFMKILKMLFSPEDAELALKLPLGLKSVKSLAARIGMNEQELGDRISEMAVRGLVIDLELSGRRYAILAPVVIGFFEYTFMRTRDEIDMKELAHLFELYMFQEDKLAHAVFQGQTQIGRSLAREEALPEGDFTEIMDWERASRVIETAKRVAVSLCACRHHHSHLDNACDRPQRTCLTLNYGADPMIKAGIAEEISISEAMDILQQCKEAGLAQTGDNVQRGLTYMCNCCGCCCGMMNAIKRYDIKNAIVSSNWIMSVDLEQCKGCGMCAKACPVNAIEIKQEGEGKQKRKWAVLDEDLCLGCGVCYQSCKFGGISLKPREKRVYTPESVFDKTVAMAIERGKLHTLLFDDPTKVSHRALGRMVGMLEKTPPLKAALAIEPLKSMFLNTMVKGAKGITGKAGKGLS